MNRKKRIALLLGGLAVGAVVPASGASGPDPLMVLTIHIKQSVAGMGTLPEETLYQNVCQPKGPFNAKSFVQGISHGDCTMENYAEHDKTVTFDMICESPPRDQKITSHGVFHPTEGFGYTGVMHTEFKGGRHAVTIDAEYSAKQAGGCTYHPAHASN